MCLHIMTVLFRGSACNSVSAGCFHATCSLCLLSCDRKCKERAMGGVIERHPFRVAGSKARRSLVSPVEEMYLF